MNCWSLPTSVWSHMIQSTIVVIGITSTRHQKGKVKEIHIYRYNNSHIDIEAAIMIVLW